MKKSRKNTQKSRPDGASALVQQLSTLDLLDFGLRLPSLLRSLCQASNSVWLQSDDINANGTMRSALRLGVKTSERVRASFSQLLRRQVSQSYEDGSLYWCFSYRGYVVFVALLNVPKSYGRLFEVVEGLFRNSVTLTEAKSMAFIDDVTQLYNQRYLHLVLDKEIRRSERAQQAFSILFIDIDHFKSVNDSAGHVVGSKLLVQVSDVLKQNIRVLDYGFRYGGDEFLMILVGTESHGALEVGERIRSQIESTPFIIDGRRVKLTLSIGVASFPEHAQTKEEIIRMADEAMYRSKNKSRNVVSVAG